MSALRTVAAGALVLSCSGFLAGTALAQSAPAYPPVLRGTDTAPTTAVVAETPRPAGLPFTGQDFAALGAAGALALGAGVTTLVLARRRAPRAR